jgi:hypothetical protein
LRILSLLSQQDQNICAADVAKLLDIHVSTAKKYLDLLCKYYFIEEKSFPNKPGRPTYYSVKSKKFTITLDMTYLGQSLDVQPEEGSLPNSLIREKPNLSPRVTYTIDNEDIIRDLTIKRRTRAKRYVKYRITLSKDESNFMKYLPHPTMEPEPFLEICKKANLANYYTIKGILPFIEKLTKFDIIEVIT